MRSLHAHGFGRIHSSAELQTNNDGNQFLLMAVEFEDRILTKTSKLYSQRVTFRSFDTLDMDRVADLTAGRWVVIDGTCDAVAEKSENGWWYANPRVTGRVHQILDTNP
jgi:hypothetical protein